MTYQDYTLHPPPHLYEVQKYLSQLQITLILLIGHISSCSYQAVQSIEYSRKSSNTITGTSHSIGAINFTMQDFNRLMQLRPFYFAIQINVSSRFIAQKTLVSHVASFPHICKLQQIFQIFLSAILYYLSAILQAERSAICLYDALNKS